MIRAQRVALGCLVQLTLTVGSLLAGIVLGWWLGGWWRPPWAPWSAWVP
jgi:hypothetical protein